MTKPAAKNDREKLDRRLLKPLHFDRSRLSPYLRPVKLPDLQNCKYQIAHSSGIGYMQLHYPRAMCSFGTVLDLQNCKYTAMPGPCFDSFFAAVWQQIYRAEKRTLN